MKRAAQILLIPFWLAGFTVGVVMVVMLTMWRAGKSGYDDITSWVEGQANVETD